MDHVRRVALALGSGGARGYAHIGVIEVLEERGYEIVGISGASSGALMGGLHAAGALDDYTTWVQGLGRLEIIRLFDPALSAAGALRAEKVFAILRDLLGDHRIEDLPMPFTAVATDLFAHREVWFQEGPLDAALRASIAIPSLITPVVLNGRVLVDGGMLNPVPIAPLAAVSADAVIAVSLNGESHTEPEIPLHANAEEIDAGVWIDRVRRRASEFLDRESVRTLMERIWGPDAVALDAALDALEPDDDLQRPDAAEVVASLGKFEMMNHTFEAMQSVLMRYRMAGYPPDVLVEVPKDAARTMEFHRADELIALGRTLTIAALDEVGMVQAAPSPTTTGPGAHPAAMGTSDGDVDANAGGGTEPAAPSGVERSA